MSGGTRAPIASLGLALSDTRLVAVCRTPDGRIAWRDVALPIAFDAWRAAVQVVLREFLGEAPTGAAEVRIALLSPAVDVRVATLPPVNDADARRLVARNAARHFLREAEPLRIGVSAPVSATPLTTASASERGHETRDARLIAGASARRIRALADDVIACGGRVRWIAPAAVLWPAASNAATGHVLVVHATQVECMAWRDGQLHTVRKGRHESVHEMLPRGASVLLVQASAEPEVASALAACREQVQRVGGTLVVPLRVDGASDERDAMRLAAWWALIDDRRDVPLALIDDDAPGAVRPKVRGSMLRTVVVAGALLLVAGVGYRWWLERDLAAIRRERASLEQTLTDRGLRAGPGATGTLARAAHDSLSAHMPWSVLLGDAAARLPADAWVRTLAARGDSLVLEVVARDAARAWSAIDASPQLAEVAVTGPVRRERSADGAVSERVTLRARRVAPGAPSSAAGGAVP